jgi:integrase/recombinase XerD
VQAYGRDLRRYESWCTARGVLTIEAITANDVSDYAGSLRHADDFGPALSASSSARGVIAVRGFHKFGVREGWSSGDPCVDVLPSAIPKRLPKALSYDEVARILDAAGDLDTASGLRDRALLELLYGTGTRISEAIGLDIDDIDFEQRTLVVTGKGDKQRRLPLGEYAASALSDYLVRGRPVFAAKGRGTHKIFLNTRGGRLSRQSAWLVLSSAAERAGISAAVSPHTMRHSFATHLLEGGADVRVVQELLGHASVTTTQIYTQVTAETLRQVYATSHPRAL